VEPDALLDESVDGCTVLGAEPASTTDCARTQVQENESARIHPTVWQRTEDTRGRRKRIRVERVADAHIGPESVRVGDMSFFCTH
jgi:hypothetical protein